MHTEAKKLSSPTGKIQSSFLSIEEVKAQQKKKAEQQEQSEDNYIQQKESKPFSYDDLKMAWRKFAYRAKEEGLDTLFTALTCNDPLLIDDHQIKHEVENDVQKSFLAKNELKLMGFLRKELENFEIELSYDVGNTNSENKNLYSGKEKYKDMAERNPHLQTFLQRFKLDIEF